MVNNSSDAHCFPLPLRTIMRAVALDYCCSENNRQALELLILLLILLLYMIPYCIIRLYDSEASDDTSYCTCRGLLVQVEALGSSSRARASAVSYDSIVWL